MTRVVIASDKFKGSATAEQIAEALAAGLRRGGQDVSTQFVPVADGGDGTVDAALSAGAAEKTHPVTGPYGEKVTARYALTEDGTAVLEAAEACGLRLLDPRRLTDDAPDTASASDASSAPDEPNDPAASDTRRLDAATADTRGVGELILAALDAGATEVILGLGGTATTDAGAGLARALGARILTSTGEPAGPGGAGVAEAARVDLAGLDPRLKSTAFTVASDVTNPLTGPDGAAAVYGPQKGLREEQIPEVDAALARYARLLERELGVREGALAEAAGSGAAGGLGFAALTILGARMRPGAEVLLDMVEYNAVLDEADLVITGEGKLDAQTLHGKAPAEVASRAVARGIPVIAVCGASELGEDQAREAGLREVHQLVDLEPDTERAMAEPLPLLERIGEQIGGRLEEILGR